VLSHTEVTGCSAFPHERDEVRSDG
jgi:hypothetical protein